MVAKYLKNIKVIMVLIALCIAAVIFVILLSSLESNDDRKKNTQDKDTALKPEFNEELREMIHDLETKKERLAELSRNGFELYSKLPAGLRECEKLKTLDDSNWALRGAAIQIENAIERIKDAMI